MRATRSIHLALFLLAASILMLEVALTRIFSITLWNHYTFLVISTALLGFGAAGTFLAVRRVGASEEEVRRLLARSCVLFALTTIASTMLVTRLDLEPTQILITGADTAKLVLMYVLVSTPFFFAGLAICRLLSAFAGQISTIYFADLVGAGVGALGVTFLLDWIGAPATIVGCGLVALVAAGIFAGPGRFKLGHALTAVFALGAFAVARYDPWDVPAPRSKPLRSEGRPVSHRHWSLHARIDVLEPEARALTFGSGVSSGWADRPVEYRTFFMDGSNPSRLIRKDQDPWFLDAVLTATPYALAPPEPEVLIIGAGGGIDVKVALHHGASQVTALEINPVTVAMVENEFADYLGGYFSAPNVELLAKEGRSYLTMDERRYDVIRLTGVDTRAAAATGANSLDHAYLYTTEAIHDLYEHLTERGAVAISRHRGWHTERLLVVIQKAFDELGLGSAEDRLVVTSNGRWSDVLVRRAPLTPQESEELVDWARQARLEVVYDPHNRRDNVFDRLIRATAEERDRLVAASEKNISAVTDDQPFFFEPQRLGTVLGSLAAFDLKHSAHSGYAILLITLLQTIVLSAAFILYPLVRRSKVEAATRGRAWTSIYFSLLGLGFILVELVLIQKYTIVVGGPAYAMSVVLFSILIFSGIGAFVSRRVDISSRGALAGALAVLLVLIVATGVFLRVGLASLLEFDFLPRIALSVLTLAPISFALGWPFPLGVRLLERGAPQLVPWAWAANACLTVVGSVLCLIVSMNWGFSATLVLAGLCYVGATACMARAPFAAREAAGEREVRAGALVS